MRPRGCQRLVKQALGDKEAAEARRLTTANSISLGRMLPQIAYYLWGLAQWQRDPEGGLPGEMPDVVVPSGNFGNLTAAVYARGMGAPLGRLIAATNVNDAGARYLRTGLFAPRGPVRTVSNAMDVGSPSNLARLQSHYGENIDDMRRQIAPASITDEETLREIQRTHEESGSVVDPHTAVGLAAARKLSLQGPTIVMATAHPAKFPEVIERALGASVPLPPALGEVLERPKQSRRISAHYAEFRNALIGSAG